ncbi:GDP-fucose protein O-fucosyltransferase 2, putative [Plasmodium ovale]|uniref:GDP-fucose protein O-fucosyltransferase 2 n=1 Tax=Plasmodium ovale TaxID=36330 RepID=A0A1D3U7N9_PLAOA|nr:GDP-fucose protein O-fucosyltransferase 2, putative [Plasmodium ovale]
MVCLNNWVASLPISDSSFVCKKDDVYLSDNFYFLKKKKYVLYDVNIGEGFNLQKEVLYRMSLVVVYLNQMDKENVYYLVLPPWCYVTHWGKKTYDQIKWNFFFNMKIVQNVIPVIEYAQYEKLYGSYCDYIISFKPLVGEYSSGKKSYNILPFDKCYIEHYKYKQICKNCEYNYSVIYSGNCTKIKGKKTECNKFYFITSYFVSLLLHQLFLYNNNSILIKQGSNLLSPFVNELWENNVYDILLFSENLINDGNVYIKDTLKTSNYLGIHLRYNDFLKITSYDIPPLRIAILKTIYIFFLTNCKKIFISTDEKNKVHKIVNKNFKEFKHIFYFYENSNYHPGEVAIIDQWICTHAKVFIGNLFSRFSMHIKWERHLINKGKENDNLDLCGYNINNNEKMQERYRKIEHLHDEKALQKLNNLFVNYTEKDKKYIETICFDFPSHFPNSASTYRKRYMPHFGRASNEAP